MRRSNRVKWSELKVGVLLLGAFGMVMGASFFGGGTSIFQSKKLFRAYFTSVNGLTTGSPVWMRGVEVGNVRSIKFDPETHKIEVVGKVRSGVWHMVTTDSKAKISAIGLIGDKFIDLIPGTPGAPVLAQNGAIEVIEDDVDKLFREGAWALENMNALAKDFKIVLGKIVDGEGAIGKLFNDTTLYDNLNQVITELNATLRAFNENQSRAFASLESGVASFEKLADALTDSGGTVGRLLFDTTLYADLTGMTGKLNSILDKIESGQGTMGAAVNDPALYDNLKDLVARVDNLILDIETNPKKYFNISVF